MPPPGVSIFGKEAPVRMRSRKILGWRRIASAIWRGPADPQIFGILELDAAPALELITRIRAGGTHVTVTDVVGRAIAYALAKVPELNVRLRWGRHVPRRSIDVFFITAVGGGHDLSGVKVEDADHKSVVAVASELTRSARALKAGADARFSRSKRLMERIPIALLRPILRALSWLAGAADLNLGPLGVDRSPFGSAMVSSVGMLGLQIGFSPLAWMYRVPLLFLVGEVSRKPVAVDGEVQIRPILPLTASIDHRFADGWHLSRLVAALREYLAAPERFEPAVAAPSLHAH